MRTLLKTLISVATLLGGGVALAQSGDWTPPKSPALHEPSDLDYKNKYSGPFLGLGLNLGQANVAGGSSGLFYAGQAEFGYISGFQNLDKLEISLELSYGGASFKLDDDDSDLEGTMVGMAKIGYGYALDKGFFSSFKLGLGVAATDLSTEVGGVKFESKDTATGLALMGAWSLTMRLTDSIELEGAFEYSHMQFDVGEIEGGNMTVDLDRKVILNVPSLSVGMRFVI